MSSEIDPDLTALSADTQALGPILEGFRPRLRTMVKLRLDPRMRRRIDPSDVLQEAFVDVARRLPDFLEKPEVPFYVWVRFLTAQRVADVHRRHFGRRNRDLRREKSTPYWAGPEASTIVMAGALLDRGPSPSQVLLQQERIYLLQSSLEALSETDREVIVLRHLEELANQDVATILGITPAGASLRYVRAMRRLGALLLSREGRSESGEVGT